MGRHPSYPPMYLPRRAARERDRNRAQQRAAGVWPGGPVTSGSDRGRRRRGEDPEHAAKLGRIGQPGLDDPTGALRQPDHARTDGHLFQPGDVGIGADGPPDPLIVGWRISASMTRPRYPVPRQRGHPTVTRAPQISSPGKSFGSRTATDGECGADGPPRALLRAVCDSLAGRGGDRRNPRPARSGFVARSETPR